MKPLKTFIFIENFFSVIRTFNFTEICQVAEPFNLNYSCPNVFPNEAKLREF